MSIAVCLLLYSAAVLVFGPRVLPHLTRTGYAPRLGVAVWLSAVVSVLASWAVAAVLIVIDVVRHWDSPMAVLASCAMQFGEVLTGQAGLPAQIGLLVIAATATGALTALCVRLARTLIRLRHTAFEHAQAVRIVGRRTAEPDVIVLPSDQPAAYCVAGRPAAIVLSTATLAALDKEQLAAVLAHERAHLAGRHPQIIAVLRALTAVLPRVQLTTQGAAEISRLLEMCADDTAARHHGHRTLLSGLLGLASTTTVPAPALGAATVAVLSRAQRLSTPPEFAARAQACTMLTISLTAIAAGPLITIALAASGALLCNS